MRIRREAPSDIAAVREVNEAAFETPAEAGLVDALRDADAHTLSLVAEEGGRVVGHILFSPARIEGATGATSAVGLAPMAVVPDLQNRGIGTALVREGLTRLREAGHEVLVVLGHPHYYPRFGFVPSVDHDIRSEYDVPPEVFMVLELAPGALAGRSGVARYHPAFAGL